MPITIESIDDLEFYCSDFLTRISELTGSGAEIMIPPIRQEDFLVESEKGGIFIRELDKCHSLVSELRECYQACRKFQENHVAEIPYKLGFLLAEQEAEYFNFLALEISPDIRASKAVNAYKAALQILEDYEHKDEEFGQNAALAKGLRWLAIGMVYQFLGDDEGESVWAYKMVLDLSESKGLAARVEQLTGMMSIGSELYLPAEFNQYLSDHWIHEDNLFFPKNLRAIRKAKQYLDELASLPEAQAPENEQYIAKKQASLEEMSRRLFIGSPWACLWMFCFSLGAYKSNDPDSFLLGTLFFFTAGIYLHAARCPAYCAPQSLFYRPSKELNSFGYQVSGCLGDMILGWFKVPILFLLIPYHYYQNYLLVEFGSIPLRAKATVKPTTVSNPGEFVPMKAHSRGVFELVDEQPTKTKNTAGNTPQSCPFAGRIRASDKIMFAGKEFTPGQIFLVIYQDWRVSTSDVYNDGFGWIDTQGNIYKGSPPRELMSNQVSYNVSYAHIDKKVAYISNRRVYALSHKVLGDL